MNERTTAGRGGGERNDLYLRVKSLQLVNVPLLVTTLLQIKRSIVHRSRLQAIFNYKNRCFRSESALIWLIGYTDPHPDNTVFRLILILNVSKSLLHCDLELIWSESMQIRSIEKYYRRREWGAEMPERRWVVGLERWAWGCRYRGIPHWPTGPAGRICKKKVANQLFNRKTVQKQTINVLTT